MLGLIAEQADLTLDEIVAVMRKRRIAGSRSAVRRFFKRDNVSFKKSLRAAEQQRADVVRARRALDAKNKACLTQPDWCLLMRPQPTPPWCGFAAAARVAFG